MERKLLKISSFQKLVFSIFVLTTCFEMALPVNFRSILGGCACRNYNVKVCEQVTEDKCGENIYDECKMVYR